MSRVIANTVRSAAVGGLVLLTVALSACGGDDENPSGAAPTPAGETTASDGTTPAKSASAGTQTRNEPSTDGAPAEFTSSIAVTKEGTKAIEAASDKAISTDELAKRAEQLRDQLEQAKFKVTVDPVLSDDLTILRTKEGVIFNVFSNDKSAARQAASVLLLLEEAKMPARVAREGNVVLTYSSGKRGGKLKASEIKQFERAHAAVGRL